MATRLNDVCTWLEQAVPLRLAEDWDNVGLLVGDRSQSVQKVMTCLTVTPDSAREAVEAGADVVVTHHPLPFRPLKRITADNSVGGMLLSLIRAGVAIYSPHTAYDSAGLGINQQWAEALGLSEIVPICPRVEDPDDLGSGRIGQLRQASEVGVIAEQLKSFLRIPHVRVVGNPDFRVQSVALACGSAGEFLVPTQLAGGQLLVTGETSFHTCLEAEALGMAMILVGHFASERFAVETLAQRLQQGFPEIDVWASRAERDPLTLI